MNRNAFASVAALSIAVTVSSCAHVGSRTSGPAVGDVTNGRHLFETNCTVCHGTTGREGGMGPSLRSEYKRMDLDAVTVFVHHPQPPMPALYPTPLDGKDVLDVATYVETL